MSSIFIFAIIMNAYKFIYELFSISFSVKDFMQIEASESGLLGK